MRSSTDLIVSPEAEGDLGDIYAYTREAWDEQQADAFRQHVILYHHDADAATVTILRVVNPRRLR